MQAVLPSTALAWASMNILTKKRYEFLLQEFGTLEGAWEHLDLSILKKLGCKEDTSLKVLNERDELDLDEQQKFLAQKNIHLITLDDERYPDLLSQIADPPVFLFAQGNIALLTEPMLALVGTRKMSLYGKRVVSELIPPLIRAGIVTVSGLAQGIDAEVARETLHAGGRTVAVLGHGLSAIYPKSNERLGKEIIEAEGLLLTEYPLSVSPSKFTFPARNRIIAGMTLGTIVVEAGAQSGSLITASLALEDGREVFAIPGQIFDPNMAGTHELIAKGGAKLITSSEDVLRELGVVLPVHEISNYRAQTEEEQILLTHLNSIPQSVDELVEKTHLAISQVNATLTLMELKGGAKNVGMGKWVKGK